MENLAVASAIGFIAVVVAAASLFADSSASADESSAIVALGGGSSTGAKSFDDPAFSRVHAVSGGSAPYGAVLSLRDRRSALRAALLFKGDGTVAAARELGHDPAPAWLDGLVGMAGPSALPSSKAEAADPDAVSGATESFLAWADAVGRASKAAASMRGAAR
jgi:hypothetical protein